MQQHNLEKPTVIEAAVNEVVVFNVAFVAESKIQICRCFCSTTKRVHRNTIQYNPLLSLLFFLSQEIKDMNMGSDRATMEGSSKKRLSGRGLGRFLKQQRARLYIMRRCVVMLLCSHD
ncbi:hypothetical protein LOK49_LG04G03304 [Camellia lanceoleosa]|uniref:Uncharacterized protein n=1 Tax=Camellia lanceoleosa TaxID=1840588 RepID=A0ACC0I5A5_9ERIC|nr:hypothetical protein LOK49_LG04G03304 [Camellia lanceoleosa]